MNEYDWTDWWNKLDERLKEEIRNEMMTLVEDIDGLDPEIVAEGSTQMAIIKRSNTPPFERRGDDTIYYPNHPLFYTNMSLAIYYAKYYQLTGTSENLSTDLHWQNLPEEINVIGIHSIPLVASNETELWNNKVIVYNFLYETALIINGWMRDRNSSKFTSIAGAIKPVNNFTCNYDSDDRQSPGGQTGKVETGSAEGGRNNEYGGYAGGYGPIRLDLEYEERFAKARSRTQDVPVPTPGHEWQIKKDGRWVDAHLINSTDIEDINSVIGFILEKEELELDNLSFTTNNPYLVEMVRAPWSDEGIPNDLFLKFYLNPQATAKLVNKYNQGEDQLVRRKKLTYSVEDEFQRMFKPPEELLLDSIRDVIHGIKTPDGWYNIENMYPTPHTAHVKISQDKLTFNGLVYDAQYLKDWIRPTNRSLEYFYEAWEKLQLTDHGDKSIHWMDSIAEPAGQAGLAEGITHAALKTRFSFEELTEMENEDLFRPLQFMSIPELEALKTDILELWGDLQRERNIASMVDVISAIPLAGTVANQAYKIIRKKIGSGEWVDWSDTKFVFDIIKEVLGVLGESSLKSILKSTFKPFSLAITIAKAESRHITHKACSGYLSGLLAEIETLIDSSTADNRREFERNKRFLPQELKWALWREVEFAARVWRRYNDLAESRIENVSIGFSETEKGYIQDLYLSYANMNDFNKVQVVNQLFISPYGGAYVDGSPYTVEVEGQNRLAGIRGFDHYTYMDQVLLPFVSKQIKDLQKFTFIDYFEQPHLITQFEDLMLQEATSPEMKLEYSPDETGYLYMENPQGYTFRESGLYHSNRGYKDDWSSSRSIPFHCNRPERVHSITEVDTNQLNRTDRETRKAFAENWSSFNTDGVFGTPGRTDVQIPSPITSSYPKQPVSDEFNIVMDNFSPYLDKDEILDLDTPVVSAPSTLMNHSPVIPASTGFRRPTNVPGRSLPSNVNQNINKIVRMVINRYETVNERRMRDEIVNLMKKNNIGAA